MFSYDRARDIPESLYIKLSSKPENCVGKERQFTREGMIGSAGKDGPCLLQVRLVSLVFRSRFFC